MSVRRAAVVLGLCAIVVAPLHATSRYDPRLGFRTIVTPRFQIHFHLGEEALARRLARIAEDVADRLAVELGQPSGRVHVVLVNQTDLSNGWATPTPYNLIEINAVPPPSESVIGNTDDWLRLVFTHEYTHIVHLDASRGWIGGLRRVFGRLPAVFPNLFLPLWQIEGIATYDETALTGQGRVQAADFRMMLDQAALARRFDPLDRASGRLVDWPSGNAPYVYGAYFHQYFADRFGPGALSRLSKETAGRLPYFGSGAFRKVFRRSLGTLWDEFEADTRAKSRAIENEGERLTHHGFNVSAPHFSADGRLFYTVLTPHGFPSLMELPRDGSAPRAVASRYLGGRLSATGDALVFDQLELVRNVALQSELYAVGLEGGRVRPLTHAARAGEPDVSPDGRFIVCTVQALDRRELAVMDVPLAGAIGRPAPLVSEASTEFSSPRWAPDGRAIVAERRRLGGPSEIVVVDVGTGAVTRLSGSARGRNVAPVWTADGRAVLFASDRDDDRFAIYEVTLVSGALRRLEATGAGAQSPALSPDGRTLVFVGYTPDGHDLFSLPFASARWTDVLPEFPAVPSPASSRAGQLATPTVQNVVATGAVYRPWRTLAPHFWTPIAERDAGEIRAGAGTSGVDALGRHAFVATVAWSASRGRPDWQLAYAYDRWGPTIIADVSGDIDPWREGELRSRDASIGALFPVRRVRWSSTILAAFHTSNKRFECGSCAPAVDALIRRRALRFGWQVNTAKSYGYSVSGEEGGALTITSELDRRALGATGDAGAAIVSLRGYRRLWPRHGAIALRTAAASAWGDRAVRRQFAASGHGPEPPGFVFGTDAIGLLRGFDPGALLGRHAAVANVDYRFPLLGVQRGIGTLPFFLRTVHGAIFADVGHAWSDQFRPSDVRHSFGAEISLDTIVGYSLPLTLTTGAAWRTDPATHTRGFVAFGRIGRAF